MYICYDFLIPQALWECKSVSARSSLPKAQQEKLSMGLKALIGIRKRPDVDEPPAATNGPGATPDSPSTPARCCAETARHAGAQCPAGAGGTGTESHAPAT